MTSFISLVDTDLKSYLPKGPEPSPRIRQYAHDKLHTIVSNNKIRGDKGTYLAYMQSITNEILGIEPKPVTNANSNTNANTNANTSNNAIPPYPLSLREEASSSALSKIKQLRESFSHAVHKNIHDNVPRASSKLSNNNQHDYDIPQRSAMNTNPNNNIFDNDDNDDNDDKDVNVNNDNTARVYLEEKFTPSSSSSSSLSLSSKPIIENIIIDDGSNKKDYYMNIDDDQKELSNNIDINVNNRYDYNDDDDQKSINIKGLIINNKNNDDDNITATLKPSFADEVDLSGKWNAGSMKSALSNSNDNSTRTNTKNYRDHVNTSLDLSNMSLNKFKQLTGQY